MELGKQLSLPERRPPRPVTVGPMPHSQVTEQAPPPTSNGRLPIERSSFQE